MNYINCFANFKNNCFFCSISRSGINSMCKSIITFIRHELTVPLTANALPHLGVGGTLFPGLYDCYAPARES